MITKVNRNNKHYLEWTVSIQEVVKMDVQSKPKSECFDTRLVSQIEVSEIFKVKKEYQILIKSVSPYLTS